MGNQLTGLIHILNGDALKEQFPESIPGDLIVARECLVDGNLEGDSLQSFFETRASYLSKTYGGPKNKYIESTVPEFEKICQLPASCQVNLWFEDDLFCQTNLWFIASLLVQFTRVKDVSLIRPTGELRYGFGGMSADNLQKTWMSRTAVSLDGLEGLSELWHHYKQGDLEGLQAAANPLLGEFPFLEPAIQAEIDRTPKDGGPGKPHDIVLQLINSAEYDTFGKVFKEFTRLVPIYGYGDLQVKKIWEKCKLGNRK